MAIIGNYFYTEVKGMELEQVNRRVNDLLGRGFEVHSRSEAHDTKAIYRRTDSIGRSKRAFDRREDRVKYSVVMRRENTKCTD